VKKEEGRRKKAEGRRCNRLLAKVLQRLIHKNEIIRVAASFAARFISSIFLLSSDSMDELANLSYHQEVVSRVAGVVGNRDG